ncbi:hypothetical protein PtrSN002B_003184 [Pyrenophora tritici-repentis]|uniref:Uncharacterized protein n=2 Tax=Pyrenophora tritici-repentis TaxID=45151 RepID=A0A2W1G849_9PLEO|nr:hypothetical protein PtrV1_13726 [Pyrenophora tritici-repentis]KAF7447243.1 hypothetical protein A1F99_086900 [Pyrenophora tritici-repentis]KAF7569602.1 hypothetical protein PtrM4_120170 [Pyrenophora tritici-repentis]KAG9382659.1 hypothetical protein A1F94_006580 [Pyrenophora tritici-repentis]KAI0573911.1 hypothetical protein Alg130_09903 [Pyrenophora tritici-repentis]
MRFEIPTIVALLSSFASAVSVCRPHSKLNPFNDSRGCTIFKDQTCGSDPGFAIPGDSGYCADLNNLFADYDGKVRSFRVEKGYQCEFYLDIGCPAYKSHISYGSLTESVNVPTLNSTYDRKIRSIYCCNLN